MIQVQFTDEGKLHTVTFSGEDADVWASHFTEKLRELDINYEWRVVSVLSEVEAGN